MSITEYLVLGYFVSLMVTLALLLVSMVVQIRRREISQITLRDLALAVFLAVCPLLNTVAAVLMVVDFFREHLKDTVIYRVRDDG
jgi:hypothetical protein